MTAYLCEYITIHLYGWTIHLYGWIVRMWNDYNKVVLKTKNQRIISQKPWVRNQGTAWLSFLLRAHMAAIRKHSGCLFLRSLGSPAELLWLLAHFSCSWLSFQRPSEFPTYPQAVHKTVCFFKDSESLSYIWSKTKTGGIVTYLSSYIRIPSALFSWQGAGLTRDKWRWGMECGGVDHGALFSSLTGSILFLSWTIYV